MDAIECPNCGDPHSADDCTWVPSCRYCDDPAQNPEAEFAALRCDHCAEVETRNNKRERLLAEEGWI